MGNGVRDRTRREGGDLVTSHGSERGPIEDYKDLELWQRAMALCETIYELTQGFPEGERYGLASQVRRAAVSIPANIAEGYARGSRQDYCRFVKIARGSAAELETELMLAERLRLSDTGAVGEAQEELTVVRRLIQGLVNALDD